MSADDSMLFRLLEFFIMFGQGTLDCILAFRLPMYILLLFILIAIFLKKRNSKFKKRKLIISGILISALIMVIWLFGSHSPTKKEYSSDNQYSYYLEKYNYNAFTEKSMSMFHETEYKVFVYDEVKRKRLYSGFAGGKTEFNNGYMGFDEEESRFYISKGDYYKLPRPIVDVKAVEEQARMRERAISDSVRLAREEKKAIRQEEIRQEIEKKKKEFADSRLILQREILDMQPIIKKWLDFHNIDITQVRLINQEKFCFDCPDTFDPKYPYYREYTSEDDRDDRIEMFYSPNGRRYIDLGIRYKIVDGKNYMDLDAYDTTQQGYLTDRQEKQNMLLFNFGNLGRAETVFWQNDDMFILVGYWYDDAYNWYSIDVYDMKNNFINYYRVQMDTVEKNYHYEIVMEEKGIIPFR